MKRILRWYPAAFIALALPLIIPFLHNGLPNTADIEIHMHRIISAATDISNGYFWPRWTPYLHEGFGYPIHNFYAPGIHILGALVYLLTHLDPAIILKLIQFVITLLYPIGAYLFARTFTGKAGAMVAAVAYLYTPFRFQELWVQSNLSQFCAMALLPWLLWAIAVGVKRRNFFWMLAIGLFWAAIVVAHHPTAFLFAPVAGLYALMVGLSQPRSKIIPALITVIGGLAMGLALSAVFWLPALLELRYTQISALQTGMFSIGENTVPLRSLLSSATPVDRSLIQMPAQLKIGLPQWIAALVGLLALRLRDNRALKWHVLGGAAVTALCAWMITPTSVSLWDKLPIANLVVYPWRLLGVISVAVLTGAAALPSLFPARWRTAVAAVLLAVFFVGTLPLLYAPLSFRTPYPATVHGEALFEQNTGDVGLTSADEYLPTTAHQRPSAPSNPEPNNLQWHVFLESPPPGVKARAETCSRGADCYNVTASTSSLLTFHQMLFPGWQATVNGKSVTLLPTQPFGLISFQIPAGENHIMLWYGGTPVQHLADDISLATVLGILLILMILVWRRRSSSSDQPGFLTRLAMENASSGLAKGVVVAMAAFLIVNQTILLPHTTIFRPQSDPANPPVSHPLHVTFGDTLVLEGYDLDTDSAQPGDTIQVQLYWHLLKPTTLSLSGSVKITSLDGRNVWADQNSINLGGISSINLPTDRYVVDTHVVPISSDAPPYVGHLSVSVFYFDQGSIQNLQTDQGQTAITLTDFRINGNSTADQPTLIPANVSLGNAVKLLGYQLDTAKTPGQTCLTLRWQVLKDQLSDYAVMIHQLGADGQLSAVADAPPLDGLYPSFFWRSGQILDDTHCFALNGTALALGLYDRGNGQRLEMLSDDGKRLSDDSFIVKVP